MILGQIPETVQQLRLMMGGALLRAGRVSQAEYLEVGTACRSINGDHPNPYMNSPTMTLLCYHTLVIYAETTDTSLADARTKAVEYLSNTEDSYRHDLVIAIQRMQPGLQKSRKAHSN